jgi:DNA-binding GntR family transcriptional regulator
MSDADLEELQSYVDEMQRAADAGDTHGEAVVDVEFHARVIQIADNHTLERVWRYLEPLSRTYITLIVPGVSARRIADLHVPILAALRGRDIEQVVTAYHRHFDSAGDMFRETWIDEPGAPDDQSNLEVDLSSPNADMADRLLPAHRAGAPVPDRG